MSCSIYLFFVVSAFMLLLPAIFLLGLLPQINTFLIYVCEQIEVHVFGGTGLISCMLCYIGMILHVKLEKDNV